MVKTKIDNLKVNYVLAHELQIDSNHIDELIYLNINSSKRHENHVDTQFKIFNNDAYKNFRHQNFSIDYDIYNK